MTERKSRHLAVLAALFGVAALVWMFYAHGVWVEPYLKASWPSWFGLEWFEDKEPRQLLIFVGTLFVPIALLGVIALALLARYAQLNFSTVHHENLQKLATARNALQQGLVSLDTIEREYKGKLESYEKLQEQLQELQAVKNIDTEDLRRKLNAIASASRTSAWFERGLGFLMGVMSSLLASYVWERLHAP